MALVAEQMIIDVQQTLAMLQVRALGHPDDLSPCSTPESRRQVVKHQTSMLLRGILVCATSRCESCQWPLRS